MVDNMVTKYIRPILEILGFFLLINGIILALLLGSADLEPFRYVGF